MFLDNFLELSFIANAFKGIKIAVGIVLATGIYMIVSEEWNMDISGGFYSELY